MALTIHRTIYAICPIEDCGVSFEAELDGDYLCPTCKVEMLTACPQCSTAINSSDQSICGTCGGELTE